MQYTYLLINLGTILFPLLLSFDKKVAFYKQWKYLFPAIFITAAVFIAWDIWFTAAGVWWFSHEHTLGVFLWGLPLEEWLFFFTVPYACVFIYEVLKVYMNGYRWSKTGRDVAMAVGPLLLIVAFFNLDKIYTFTSFVLAAILLLYNWLRRKLFFGTFWLAYLIQLLPFLIVNGLLTAIPVVSYNDAENLGIRIYTIPVEDSVYSLGLLLMNISLYEFFRPHPRPVPSPITGER